MKKYKTLLAVLVFTVLLLGIVRVAISNKISTGGVALGTIEDEISYYKTQNLIYKEKIYTLSSLGNINSEATKIGFIPSKSGLALGSSQALASR